MTRSIFSLLIFFLLLFASGKGFAMHPDAHKWTEEQKALLSSLWINSLQPLPDDPSNAYANDPRAVKLGRKLFFDKRLSSNGKVACATCHIPDVEFTDNLPVAHGIDDTTRRSMPLAGTAYSPWLFWDGRADSLWAQALGPLESPVEHGISRTKCAQIIFSHYRMEYEQIFGSMIRMDVGNYPPQARPAEDDQAARELWASMSSEKRNEITKLYSNIGKAIAAFVRTIMPKSSRFDEYVRGIMENDQEKMEKILTQEEAVGLKVFIGKARCINCHNGPLLTNFDFHNVGVEDAENLPRDRGRAPAINQVLSGEFNCLSIYSDAGREQCLELRFIDKDVSKYEGAFKTPSLRNVADRPPYMHAGQLKTLGEVLKFYQERAKKEKRRANAGLTDIVHGEITDAEASYLEAFLKTLSGPVVAAQ